MNVEAENNVTPQIVTKTVLKQNGIKRPESGTLTGALWDIADKLSEQMNGPAPRKTVVDAYLLGVPGANLATANTQYARWVRYHNVAELLAEGREAARAAKAAELAAAKEATKAAKEAEKAAAVEAKAAEKAAKEAEKEAARQAKADEKAAKAAAKEQAAAEAKAAKEAAKAAESTATAE